MRPNIHVRSLARRPLYLLLLCLIIGAASFGFIAHAVEYVILRRETEQLGDYYRAVGTLSPNGEDFSCLPDGIALVESSNAVTLSDQRQYASALLDGIQNIDYASTLGDDITLTPRRSESFGLGFELSGNRTTDIVFDGVLTDVVVGKNVESSCELTFSVDNIYATRPEYQVETGSVATIAYFFLHRMKLSLFPAAWRQVKDTWHVGTTIFITTLTIMALVRRPLLKFRVCLSRDRWTDRKCGCCRWVTKVWTGMTQRLQLLKMTSISKR